MDKLFTKANSLSHRDFDWNEFMEQLFQSPPREPFTFTMSFLEEMEPKKLAGLLGQMLMHGARYKYGKEISQLQPVEIGILQQYYHSLGYEVVYEVEQKSQYNPDTGKDVPINIFHIDFRPYPMRYNVQNRPERLF